MLEGSNVQKNKMPDCGKQLEKICINLRSLVLKPEIFYLHCLTAVGSKNQKKEMGKSNSKYCNGSMLHKPHSRAQQQQK